MRLDWDAIFDRLGEQPHDADFQLMNCDRCGHQYLVDDEILRLYLDPTLREHALMAVGEPWPRCRGCGALEWDLVPAETATADWSWAVKMGG
jgi:hypothetical protein